ncbi:hypothetical protein HA402_008146 [Bradysia odoriphaga]|nr:hypothetical protein HA402_008146 [Bradysia odoriphaga]
MNIEPTTSNSDQTKEDQLPAVDTPDGVHVPNVHVPETTIPQNNDTKLEEIKIVAVASAATAESISKIINDEQEAESKSIKSVNKTDSDVGQIKSSDDRNETRVISLDTIIRKGLNEQMPMTAKDIDNIVPNAIKQQQDASLKQSEKLASEKEFALVYESSDDYQSSVDDKYEDELDVNVKQPGDEQKTNAETKEVETTDHKEQKNVPPQLICETVLEETLATDATGATDLSIKAVDENQAESTQLNESNDSSASDHSFDDFESDSGSAHSSRKKQKRRESTAAENTVHDDADKKYSEEAGETGEDVANDPGPRLNRRGKPRKSYDETDNEQVKKKVGRKMKIQRYSGPKRPGVRGRPKRDDGLSCYKDLNPAISSSTATPMDELMALGHSLFSEFAPKKPGRPKRDNFLPEMNPEPEIDATNEMTADNVTRAQQNIDDPSTHPQLMFRRKPGRPKIDKESGGHIVFQNSELTVVNKPAKIKGEVVDSQDETGMVMHHSKDISIVPIIKAVTNKDISRSYNLPIETTITSYGHDRSIQEANIRNMKQDPDDNTYSMAPIDDMLEVHHVEEYIPETYDGSEGRRRGRKPKVERSTYSEMTLSEPYVLSGDRQHSKSNNGGSISVKKIEDLLEIPTRMPTLQDFSYPELTLSTTNKPSSNNNSRLNPLAAQVAHRAINKRVRGSRLSGTKPTYAELSESSNDVPESSERTMSKARKIHWKQQKKLKAAVKPHWGEQWKANLNSAKNQTPLPDDNSGGKEISSQEATSNLSALADPTSPALPINPAGLSTPKTELAHKEFDESVKEILQMRQKRVPKLKYSSYDFKVRRDPNKPKMVLKFKKKYYKKKKNLITTPVASHDSGTGTTNYEPESKLQAEGETPPVKVYKKPGPKPKPKLPAPIQSPTIPSNQDPTPPTTSKDAERIKRKYVRKSIQVETHQDEPSISPVIDNSDEVQSSKRKLYDTSQASGSETVNKKVKNVKFNELNDQSTSKIYLENYNKVLQDRNDVLLEILEQRSAEIRSLKLRVSNMTKSDDESKLTEKKDNGEESWSPAELSKAYSLQKLSKSFYSYVQDRFSLPLPPSIDVDRFIDCITVTKGLLTSMMQILEFDGETMSEVERVTILQISELKMESMYEYDDNLDNIIGPHSRMTVVVAKGLYSDWSQAVYLNFDLTTMKDILNMIIEELHKIKFPVVACVCKYVDGEPSIWSEFNIGMGCNYFSHPVTTEFIYTFYYIDDLMLATRNNFVENGFTTDICRINASPLVELIKVHDLRFPIRSETLTTKCDNISNVVNLFSKHTSSLLRILMPQNEIATSLADFCAVLGSFYRLMNSQNGNAVSGDDHAAEEPYGKNIEYQNDILNETQLHFYKLRCPGNSKMSEFQRATMMCIESLKMLQHSTKQKFKVDCFPTRNITGEYLKKRIQQSLTANHETLAHLTPLKSMGVVKDIFLQAKSADSLMFETTAKLFFDEDIDTKLPESHYVDLLIDWIAEKYEKKHTNTNNDDFIKKMHKFEEQFQSIQNPQFKIAENSVTKVFKKLKSHTFGMFLEVIHKFVVQRHLLRIKYLNAVSAMRMVEPN